MNQEHETTVNQRDELISLCNDLGVEELTSVLDFSQSPTEILSFWVDQMGFSPLDIEDPVDNPNKDLSLEDKSLRAVYRMITRYALDTYAERIYVDGIHSVKEIIDEQGNTKNSSEQMTLKDLIETSRDKIALDEKYFGDRESQRTQFQEAWSFVENLGKLNKGFDLTLYRKSSQPSLLRFESERIQRNCITYSAILVSFLRGIGLPDRQIQCFCAGNHLGVVTEMQDSTHLFDPKGSIESWKTRGKIDIHLQKINQIGKEGRDYFERYSLAPLGIRTYDEFIDYADTPMTHRVGNVSEETIHFLSPEDAIIAGILINKAVVEGKNLDYDRSRLLFEKALLFDPENSYVRERLEFLKKL